MNKIFIPKKLKVGFVKRDDTYTNKLGYVIYYDAKGKLRKEDSFNGWVDKTIPFLELDNTPQSGFVFNRGVSRHSSFNYTTAKIRVYDNRDFEFEITIGNMVEIMKHSNISHQEIEEKCVFGWDGKDHILIPVNSDIYKNAVSFTNKIENPLNVRTFIPGQTFKNRNGEEWVYLGEYMYPVIKSNKERRSNKTTFTRSENKYSFFFNPSENKFSNAAKSTMIELFDENIHPQYLEMVESIANGLHLWTLGDFVKEKLTDAEMLQYCRDFYIGLKKNLLRRDKPHLSGMQNYYASIYNFPSEIYAEQNGYLKNIYLINNYNSSSLHIDYSGYKFSMNNNKELVVEDVYIGGHSQRKVSPVIDDKLLKKMSEEELIAAGDNLYEFLVQEKLNFYKIGFMDKANKLISIKKLQNSPIEVWNNFQSWNSNY